MRRLIRAQDGTSVMEFAILAPVLIFLLFGLIEVGRYAYFAILAAHAAHTGAQWGAQDTSTADNVPGMKNAAKQDAQAVSTWTVNAQTMCSVSSAPLVPCSGASLVSAANTVYYVKVTVTGTFSALFNYPGIPANIPVSGSATMRVASQE